MDRQEFLTAKDLMNYHYCKRLIYFENVLRIPQATTIKELKGRELHQAFAQRSKRNKIVREFPSLPKEYNLSLESKELGFRTVLDCLIIDRQSNQAFPVECKDSKKPPFIYWTMKIQAFAESLLVEKNLGYSVPCAFIKFEQSGDLEKILVGEEDLWKVEDTIFKINKLISTELIPEPTEFPKKCRDCCYNKICRRI